MTRRDVDELRARLERLAEQLRSIAAVPHNETTVREVAGDLDQIAWELLINDLTKGD